MFAVSKLLQVLPPAITFQIVLLFLQVPVQDGRQTLKDWCKYTGKHTTDVATMENALPGHVKAAYAKAQAAVQARAPYEQSVAAGKPADLNLLAAYTAYIQLEQVCGFSSVGDWKACLHSKLGAFSCLPVPF